MRKAHLIAIPLTSFSLLIAVVACGPTKDSVSVTTATRSVLSQAISQCKVNLSTARTVKVGGTNHTVELCQIPETAAGLAVSKKGYAVVAQPFSYEISKNEKDALSLKLRVGMILPEKTDDEMKKKIGEALYGVCRTQIQTIFARSFQRGGMTLDLESEFNFNYTFESVTAESDVDQNVVELQDMTQAGDKESSYAFKIFADGARLYPKNKASSLEKCAGLSLAEKAACVRDSMVTANLPFCRELAKLTGTWLGLEDEQTEKASCEVPAPVPAPVSLAEKPKPRASLFMRAASEQSAEDFFKTAKLSLGEVASLLEPACPSFTKLKER